LARINRDIAASAKRDSSAMKTIAIMTMLFLPATFFAALFSMPSFDWEEPKLIQARFWIYWAFTIPTTALVFLVWIIMNNWKFIWAHCKNRL
jgi:Mg2+ and Co2+ transporter CorA